MATRPTQPLTAHEAEIVASLDSTMQPFALQHRHAVLSRGVPYVFTSGFRSRSDQRHLWEEDPSNALEPGKSMHELGFAWDATGPRDSDEWAVFGEEADKFGLEWGGHFRKPSLWHIEVPGSRRRLAQFRTMKLVLVASTVGLAGWLLIRKA